MAEITEISWCDSTFNPWIGCAKVSDGCKNCYAETLMDERYGRVKWGPQGTRVRTSISYWKNPPYWNRQHWLECIACHHRWADKIGLNACPACGSTGGGYVTRQRVFCGSLCDVFEDFDGLNEIRDDLWEMIKETPSLNWLLLTKRPENVMTMLPWPWNSPQAGGMPYNIWIGTSIENQEQVDKRIPELLKIPAKVRFLSMEPLLDKVNLWPYLGDPKEYGQYRDDNGKIHISGPSHQRNGLISWVIVGGESGSKKARPMHPNWVRSIRDQCKEAKVSFFFKQWGEWVPSAMVNRTIADPGYYVWPWGHMGDKTMMVRLGKKEAGCLLDGVEYKEWPK